MIRCQVCGAQVVYDPEDNMFVCSEKLMDQDLDGHYPANKGKQE